MAKICCCFCLQKAKNVGRKRGLRLCNIFARNGRISRSGLWSWCPPRRPENPQKYKVTQKSLCQRAPNPPEFAQPGLNRSNGSHHQREATILGVCCSYVAGIAPAWGYKFGVWLICVISTYSGLCKFGWAFPPLLSQFWVALGPTPPEVTFESLWFLGGFRLCRRASISHDLENALVLRPQLPWFFPISGLRPGMGKKWPKNGFWPQPGANGKNGRKMGKLAENGSKKPFSHFSAIFPLFLGGAKIHFLPFFPISDPKPEMGSVEGNRDRKTKASSFGVVASSFNFYLLNRMRTNVQQLTCNIDLSCSFCSYFFSFVLIELKPFVLKGKILGELGLLFGRRTSYRGFEWFPYGHFLPIWASGRTNFWRRNVISWPSNPCSFGKKS